MFVERFDASVLAFDRLGTEALSFVSLFAGTLGGLIGAPSAAGVLLVVHAQHHSDRLAARNQLRFVNLQSVHFYKNHPIRAKTISVRRVKRIRSFFNQSLTFIIDGRTLEDSRTHD